jgi:hypothetical protein
LLVIVIRRKGVAQLVGGNAVQNLGSILAWQRFHLGGSTGGERSLAVQLDALSNKWHSKREQSDPK